MRLLTILELAEFLKVSESTVRRRVLDGGLPKPIKVGRVRRWDLKEIQFKLAEK